MKSTAHQINTEKRRFYLNVLFLQSARIPLLSSSIDTSVLNTETDPEITDSFNNPVGTLFSPANVKLSANFEPLPFLYAIVFNDYLALSYYFIDIKNEGLSGIKNTRRLPMTPKTIAGKRIVYHRLSIQAKKQVMKR